MANAWRGEVALTVDGVPHVLRLTLGALAELEAALEEPSLVALAQRFESGRYATRDVLAVLLAGFRGGGVTPVPDLANAAIDGGPMRAAQVAAELLVRAFAVPEA